MINKQKLTEILDKVLKSDLSPKERGEVYYNFAVLYLRTVNELNREYEKILDSAIEVLKEMNSAEKDITAKIAAEKVKHEI
jgi:flagellin-specific chaperone FliS